MNFQSWSTNASGESEYFNGRWLAYTGADTATTADGDWRKALHPSDAREVDEKWNRSFRIGDPFEAECRLRRGDDGAYRWFLCRALPLRDETGKITRWFGTCTDVHDQRRATEGLSVLAEASAVLATSVETGETLRSVAELAVPRLGDWCTIDLLAADGSLARIATVHSDPAKLAIAHELNRRFPATPDQPGGVYAVLRTGVVQASEITDEMIIAGVADLDKRALLLALGLRSYVIAPMLVDNVAVGAVTIVSAESGHFLGPSDISRVQELARRTALAIERTRLFAETVSARDAESLSNALLRESEAKLVLSMEAGGLGSWEWDIRSDRVTWSPQTERMHGLAEGTFSGTREEFSSYIHPDDRERVASEITRTLAERIPTYHIKYRFLRTDGAVRWLEGFARLRTDANGEPISFLGVSHDVTNREELLEGEQLLAIRDIVTDAEEADGLPVRVGAEAGKALEPSHGAIGAQKAILDVVGRNALGQRARDLACDALAVVGVDVGAELLARARESALGESVHALRLRRPRDAVAPDVPLPRAESAGLHREHELRLALAQQRVAQRLRIARAHRFGEEPRALDRECGAACEFLHARDVAGAEEVARLRGNDGDRADGDVVDEHRCNNVRAKTQREEERALIEIGNAGDDHLLSL